MLGFCLVLLILYYQVTVFHPSYIVWYLPLITPDISVFIDLTRYMSTWDLKHQYYDILTLQGRIRAGFTGPTQFHLTLGTIAGHNQKCQENQTKMYCTENINRFLIVRSTRLVYNNVVLLWARTSTMCLHYFIFSFYFQTQIRPYGYFRSTRDWDLQ